ncbi:helix-turn-helix domain-containing protein [Streptomyces albidoflavus]
MAIHHMHTDTPDATLTPAEAMAVLGISRSTLNRYVDSGRLKPSKLPSGHRRFSERDVSALLAREPWDPATT